MTEYIDFKLKDIPEIPLQEELENARYYWTFRNSYFYFSEYNYVNEEFFINLSLKYPKHLFQLIVSDEDISIEYYKNGNIQKYSAIIYFPEYQENI